MKIKTILSLVSAMAIAVVSCNPYDDTAITERIDGIDQRVTRLEKAVDNINSDIVSLQTLVEALEKHKTIESVTSFSENAGGYLIRFSDNTSITVNNGASASLPVIGIARDELSAEDNSYYWTIDGEIVLDKNGNKIPANSRVDTPQIRMNDDTEKFEITWNNGVTWEEIGDIDKSGSDVGGLFKKVELKNGNVIFTLLDGRPIVIPMGTGEEFALSIHFNEIGAEPSSSLSVPFKVILSDANTVVDVIATGSYKAAVSVASNTGTSMSGTIDVTTPADLADGKVFVLAVNEQQKMSGKILSFADGVLAVENLQDNTIALPGSGGYFTVDLSTNMEYDVVIESAASKWLSCSTPLTKAPSVHKLEFLADGNLSGEDRQTTVTIKSRTNEAMTQQVVFTQGQYTRTDFQTFNGGKPITRFGEYKTTSGWTLTNGKIEGGGSTNVMQKWIGAPLAACLKGDVNNPGTLVSPLIETGIVYDSFSMSFGVSTAAANNGLSFRVTFLGPDETLETAYYKFEVHEYPALGKHRYVTAPGTFQFGHSSKDGPFRIVIENLCPTTPGSTSLTGPNIDIFLLEWKDRIE